MSDAPIANLSISIVCFNSARTMPALVDSIRGLAGQVIAVDSGSTDTTVATLEAAGATVIHQPWLGYVKQKQFALDQCSGDWILHLDADEPVSPQLAASIRSAIAKNDPAIGGYEVNRKVIYAGKVLEHAWQPEWRLRLVRKGAANWAGFDPHDKLELIDPTRHRVERLRGTLLHDTMPSMGEFLQRQAKHAATAAESLAKTGKTTSPMKLITSPTGALFKQLILRSAWRDGWRGWAAAGASSAAAMMKHLALLERTRCQEMNSGSDPDA
ncbi:MAG: glycosyltransferase family 2 protein [Phycisphaerales bacterium]|nr:glycosyltransferase family 2 protein [Phycisphaerales bacterium]